MAALFAPASAHATIPADKSAAVIFMYQRIGEDTVPQSNISVDQFKEHLNELKKGGYSVLPLEQIVAAIRAGEPLPPKTVAITFEGAYQTTLANALPLLDEAEMPYTLFFATDAIDGEGVGRMTWAQVKKLRKNKRVTLGLLPASYAHMVNQSDEKNTEMINRATARYREMLGEDPVFFAYPYGEYTAALKKQVASYTFKAAFGQHSGVVHGGSDLMSLPRFIMTNDYGDLDRFLLTANARPLPVADVVPEDSLITQNPPTIGFTVTPDLSKLDKLSCFASDQGKLNLTRVGGNRIEIRTEEPFTERRTRINCTLPSEDVVPGERQGWRWFGMLLTSAAIDEDTAVDRIPTAGDSGTNEGGTTEGAAAETPETPGQTGQN